MAIALALSILLFVAGRFGLLGPASIGLPVALLVFTGCAVALPIGPLCVSPARCGWALLASSALGIILVNHYYDYS